MQVDKERYLIVFGQIDLELEPRREIQAETEWPRTTGERRTDRCIRDRNWPGQRRGVWGDRGPAQPCTYLHLLPLLPSLLVPATRNSWTNTHRTAAPGKIPRTRLCPQRAVGGELVS